jgi:hypothetical protein
LDNYTPELIPPAWRGALRRTRSAAQRDASRRNAARRGAVR